MDPRLAPQPINRNPRAAQEINAPAHTAAPLNPFTGLAHPATPPARAAASTVPTSLPQPKPASPATAAAPPTQFKAEVVASIPVAQPGQPAAATAPSPATHAAGPAPEDDLDKILEAVNSRVKAPPSSAVAKAKPAAAIANKVKTGGGLVKQKVGSSKPIGAVLATIAVAVMLVVTAVFAYRQGAHGQVGASTAKVGTTSSASSSIQEAGNLLVRPSDLDDYSQSLQTKIDGLNDDQDFNQQPLTDKMLGL